MFNRRDAVILGCNRPADGNQRLTRRVRHEMKVEIAAAQVRSFSARLIKASREIGLLLKNSGKMPELSTGPGTTGGKVGTTGPIPA
jgi:hypothetical protein